MSCHDRAIAGDIANKPAVAQANTKIAVCFFILKLQVCVFRVHRNAHANNDQCILRGYSVLLERRASSISEQELLTSDQQPGFSMDNLVRSF
jgi:hypothetical protein